MFCILSEARLFWSLLLITHTKMTYYLGFLCLLPTDPTSLHLHLHSFDATSLNACSVLHTRDVTKIKTNVRTHEKV